MFHRLNRSLSLTAAGILALIVLGCGSSSPTRAATANSLPGATCRVNSSHDRPLIVEWAAAERNDLESALKQGGVMVVRYTGCEMELLRRCKAPGTYKYIATSRQDERLVMRDADELYAKMPIGAIGLEGMVQQGNELRLDMSMVGKYVSTDRLTQVSLFQGEDCKGATHVVVGLTAGAFEMSSAARSKAGADILLAKGSTSSDKQSLRRAGDSSSCDKARSDDPAPPAGCGAMLRLELYQVQCPPGATYEAGKGCLTGGGAQLETMTAGGPTGPNNPADDKLAAVLLEAGRAMIAAATGKKPDPKFTVTFKDADDIKKALTPISGVPPVIAATFELDLEATGPDTRTTVYVDGAVYFNGKLRWGEVSPHSDPLGKGAPQYEDKSPRLLVDQAPASFKEAYSHLLKALSPSECKLQPASSEQDYAQLPINQDAIDIDPPEQGKLANACAMASKVKTPWSTRGAEIRYVVGTPSYTVEIKVNVLPKADGTYALDVRHSTVREK